MRAAILVSLMGITLSGCQFLFGESRTLVELYNPKTHESAECGEPMHRGAPTKSELDKREACITAYKARGFEMPIGSL